MKIREAPALLPILFLQSWRSEQEKAELLNFIIRFIGDLDYQKTLYSLNELELLSQEAIQKCLVVSLEHMR